MKGRRWKGGAIFAGGLVLFFAMVHPMVFCPASGAPLSDSAGNGEAKLAADQQETESLQEIAVARASHEPLPSTAASATPEQVHISLAASGSTEEYAVTVAWATWPKAESLVFWGISQQQLPNIATGSSTNYTSGFLHSATLHGLKPSSTYYYSCGDDALAMSSVRSFVTPPKIGADQGITLGILGDLGQTEDSAATLAAIDGDPSLDLILHAGDLSYADCDQPRWDSFMRMLDPVASRLPYMVAAGNHEIETNGGYAGTKPFLAYEHRFRMPAAEEPTRLGHGCGVGGGLAGSGQVCGEGFGAEEADAAAVEAARRSEAEAAAAAGGVSTGKAVGAAVRQASRGVREVFDVTGARAEEEEEDEDARPASCCPSEWSGTYDYGNSFYSFDVGPVHVVVLNPYTATGENSEQRAWLQKDLESTDRTLTPWLVAMMHCPWYNSNLAHQGERQAETAMRAMEPLLYQHKVAVVISGHVHAYERSHPVVDFELTEDGPIHLVVGGAGNREGHAADFYPSPEWSAFRDGTAYGSGRLSIRSSSLALWEWAASGEDASLHDVAWVSNPYSPFAPGGREGGETLPIETAGESSATDGSGTGGSSNPFAREDEDGTKAPGLRIPAVTKRRTHRVARG